jgi:DNA-binding response OmpR family regulator
MKILLADDSGRLVAELGPSLAEGEHEVRLAIDGIQALQLSGSWKPDLVLARVTLARMDGLALVAALRALGRVGAKGVVLLGDGGDPYARARAKALGAAAYLGWPVDAGELLQVLRRADPTPTAVAAPTALRVPAHRRSATRRGR